MIYLLHGDNGWAIEQTVKQIVEEQAINSLYISRMRYESISEPILNALVSAASLTLDGSPQLLWLQDLPINSTLGQSQQIWELLQDIQSAADFLSSTVVISSSAVDSRIGLGRWLKTHAIYQEHRQAAPWETRQATDLVIQIAQTRGLKLKPFEAGWVVERTGADGYAIQQAVEVLALYGDALSEVVIDRLVPNQTSSGINLARSLLRRDVETGLRELEQSLLLNEPPLRLLAVCLGQIRTWLGLKAAVAQSPFGDNAALARMIQLPGNPNRIYYLKQEVASSRLESLYALLKLVIATEKAIKTGSRAELAMRQLVLAVGKAR